MLVIDIVKLIIELKTSHVDEDDDISDENTNSENDESKKVRNKQREKSATALIFVILEICVKDLIKYMPNLLNSSNDSKKNSSSDIQTAPNLGKSSFLYLHVRKCKQLSSEDVNLIKSVLTVLNDLPFHVNISIESNYKRILKIKIIKLKIKLIFFHIF